VLRIRIFWKVWLGSGSTSKSKNGSRFTWKVGSGFAPLWATVWEKSRIRIRMKVMRSCNTVRLNAALFLIGAPFWWLYDGTPKKTLRLAFDILNPKCKTGTRVASPFSFNPKILRLIGQFFL
jgi:hypothetical protein